MDVAANDVEARLGSRDGKFWSDVGGLLGAAVAKLRSDGDGGGGGLRIAARVVQASSGEWGLWGG